MDKFFKNYWFILFSGVFFTLEALYLNFGISKDVSWNAYIKIVRYWYLPVIPLYLFRNNLENILSILLNYSIISYLTGLAVFRIVCAIFSKGNYTEYFNYLKSDYISILFSILIFIILAVVKFLNRK